MMGLVQDRRVWVALVALAAVLLAGAVTFAIGGFPGASAQPALHAVVTDRPIEPLPATLTVVPGVTASASPDATRASAGGPTSSPATAPVPAPTRPAPQEPAKHPAAAPERVSPKPSEPAQPDREVVTPRVREEEMEREVEHLPARDEATEHKAEDVADRTAEATELKAEGTHVATEPVGHKASRRGEHAAKQHERERTERPDSAR